MNANSAQVVMRPFRGGRRAYTGAFRGTASVLRASLCALCLQCIVLAACTKQEPKDASTNPASAGAAGSSTAMTVAPPAGGSVQASANPSAPATVSTNDPRAAVDAGDAFPHCDSSFDDEDGGVSPYLNSCAIDERFGVFVNPNIGPDAAADGSRAHPFGTLLHAVAAAVTAHKQVFACEGTYEEPLRIGTALADGLHVFGGLSCDTFALTSADARSRVHATGDGAALTISDTRDISIERFELEDAPSADAKPGASYVGAFISNARGVVLRDVSLLAHDGEHGKDGEPPPSESAGDGVAGEDGAAACSASPNPGGSAVSNPSCRSQPGAASGSGGGGGEGTGPGGNGTYYGVAQIAGESTADWSCVQGQGAPYPANPGGMGGQGSGGRGFGALLGSGFLGFGGQDGGDGSSGGGGGGGGGAKAPTSCAGGGTATGASAGSGGSGGCGGKGGKGGGVGGTSIGLMIISSRVTVEHGAIGYGNGGDGGNGAHGQKGGKGGAGGHGGKGVSGSHNACDGAAGGDGADGGDGGGGNGGHAIGVLFAGDAPTLIDVSGEADEGKHHGGKAGTGPDATLMPSVGTPGESHFVFEF